VSFSQFNLDARLMRAIEKSGYTVPTPIQAAAIPVALSGADVIGTAQTGTGKTAAFVLPILQHLLEKEDQQTPETPRRKAHRALIVTPTRELAEQIYDTVRVLGEFTKIRCATIYGGVGTYDQERAMRGGVEIIVACPGRLLDHADSGLLKLDGIETLVLDEADRMFDMGFLPAVRRILQNMPKQRQTMLFSATFPREVEELAAAAVKKPQRISIGRSQPATTVTHALYPVTQHLKKKLLVTLLRKEDAFSMLVFTRTKHRAESVARQLVREGFKTTSLHSDRSQNQRQAALNGFKSGKYQVMVATDIAARGLDVESISHVINYDVPDTVDAYIHRIGRTGRAEQEGDAFTIVTPEDNDMVRDIERALGQKIARLTVEGFDYSAAPERLPDGEREQPQSQSRGPRQSYGQNRNDSRGGARSSSGGGRGDSRQGSSAGRGQWNSRSTPVNGNGAPRSNGDNFNTQPVVAQNAAPANLNGEFDAEQPQPSPERLAQLHNKTAGDLRREQVRRDQSKARQEYAAGQSTRGSQSGGTPSRSSSPSSRRTGGAQGSAGGYTGGTSNSSSQSGSSAARKPLQKTKRPYSSRNRAG